jgi:hypothetical protein
MAGAEATYWARRLLILILLGVTVTGCASFGNSDLYWGSRVGFRPDDPRIGVVKPGEPACDALNEYVRYAVNLKEAYRTRATQNRSWIYVAAITGLGVAAASGALAAATAVAAGTLAVLAISGGFTAGVFVSIDNSELANVYTVAANDIGTSLANTEARVGRCPFDEECRAQLAYLANAVSNVSNKLETARTSSAAGALVRATAQRTLLDQEIARAQAQGRVKEAAEKGEMAAKDALVAEAAEREATVLGEKAKEAPADARAQQAAGVARGRAEELRRQADRATRDADDANAKLDEDAAARAAAAAPVTPPCLR